MISVLPVFDDMIFDKHARVDNTWIGWLADMLMYQE